MFKLMIHIT